MSGSRNNGGQNGSSAAIPFIFPVDQSQDQDQGQGQLQAEAQLQAQAEAQGQGQGQGQGQEQTQSSTNDNSNDNDSFNGNLNGSLNGNLNGNLNYNESVTKVTVDVGVTADVAPSEPAPVEAPAAPAFNLSDFSFSDGNLVVMPDFGTQTTGNGGHNFHLDQVNSLVDNDSLSSPGVSLTIGGIGGDPGIDSGTGAGFSFAQAVNASNSGGAAVNLDDHSTSGAVSSAASAANEAFTQHITLGANIQYNSTSVVGGDSLSDVTHDAGAV